MAALPSEISTEMLCYMEIVQQIIVSSRIVFVLPSFSKETNTTNIVYFVRNPITRTS